MRKRYYISFNIPREKEDHIRKALSEIECEQWWQPPPNERGLSSFENNFFSEDMRLQKLIEVTTQEGIRIFERVEHIYSNEELRSFPFLVLGIDRKEINPFGPNFGTTYDLSQACPQCGTGAIQTSPLLLPFQSLPKTGLICKSSTEILIATPLADTIKASDVSGLEMRQVCDYRSATPLPWWQMISTYDMPKISKKSKNLGRDTDIGWGCPVCERDMHVCKNDEPLDMIYDIASLGISDLPDVVQTWERFGKSGIHWDDFKNSRFAPPLILVKPKIFDIFQKLKVKHAEFHPVRIE